MTLSIHDVKVVTGNCPYHTGELAFQDPAPIHQCVFLANNLHVVTTREEAFSLVASVEKGCGSCSNIILHPIANENKVEIIWSGCGNVKSPIIDKALTGLQLNDLNIVEENNHSAHILVALDCSPKDIENRFMAVYSS
ncbi:MAG: hypothetical protein K9L60_07200 [Methylovulum sp.]|jgi:hypothetical protein|nr:hypothetical protein [Methylovulum sp.]MCF7999079.1 hypothetical protein [Methylovulum sp.]